MQLKIQDFAFVRTLYDVPICFLQFCLAIDRSYL